MEWAKAIRYGGEPVHASECEYEDYKDLVLHCFECPEPVILCREHERNGVLISPHFKHRHNPDQKDCELRVGRYTSKNIRDFEAKARGQRLEFLHQWFREVFIRNISKSQYFIASEEDINTI